MKKKNPQNVLHFSFARLFKSVNFFWDTLYIEGFMFNVLHQLEIQGRIQDFHLRGGAKDYVPARTLRAQNRLTFGRGPGSSRVVLILFHAIWALFLSILIKIWIKKT